MSTDATTKFVVNDVIRNTRMNLHIVDIILNINTLSIF